MANYSTDSIKDSDFLGFTAENDLFEQFGLTEYISGILSLEDVRKHDFKTAVHDSREIKWVLISKLISLNSKARNVEIEPYFTTKQNSTHDKQENVNRSFDDFYSSVMTQFNPESTVNVQLNPLDVFLAIFLCCSPFLKQIIISKMFYCRLAIPFISSRRIYVGQPIMWLWPLRSIMIEGRLKDDTLIQESIIKSKLKIVSFIRIGSPDVSKSKLLNEVMTDQYQDTFFNKDCPSGTSKRTLYNDLIEASWFFPTRDAKDIFAGTIMFLNLRGNGLHCKTQCQILKTTSNIVLVLLEPKIMPEKDTYDLCISLHESDVSVIYAVDCSDKDQDFVFRHLAKFIQNIKPFLKNTNNTKFIKIFSKKGAASVRTEIRDFIKMLLNKKPDKTIESMQSKLVAFNVKSDEQLSENCSRGREITKSIIEDVRKHKKNHVLPFQTRFWLKWTKSEKQQRKTSECLSVKEIDELEQKKKDN